MNETMNRFLNKEWEKKQEPFQMAPHVYYVGTKYVGSFLLDTDEGLVLIDQGFAETVYLLLESIRKLGFDPEKIKYLLVSHGHFDHCGGTRLIQEYSGAKVLMSKEDFQMKEEHPVWVWLGNQNAIDFEVDGFFNNSKPLDFGNIKVRTILTAGHTPGTTSFLFEDTDKQGNKYQCGLHGGVGVNTLIPEFYEEFPDWPQNMAQLFLESMDRMLDVKVDIPLPSHPMQIPIIDKMGTYVDGRGNPFINPQGWIDLLTFRRQQAEKLVRN